MTLLGAILNFNVQEPSEKMVTYVFLKLRIPSIDIRRKFTYYAIIVEGEMSEKRASCFFSVKSKISSDIDRRDPKLKKN